MSFVRYWRRFDKTFRAISKGIDTYIGQPLFGTCYYCNGLENNGIHIIDLVRMFFGEPTKVSLLHSNLGSGNSKSSDVCHTFCLKYSEFSLVFVEIPEIYYRENGIQLWGSIGRLDILNEGLVICHYQKTRNRAMHDCWEIPSDKPSTLINTVGTAIYNLYSNVVSSLNKSSLPKSSGESALLTAKISEAVIRQIQNTA